jgi:hypothetical protein
MRLFTLPIVIGTVVSRQVGIHAPRRRCFNFIRSAAKRSYITFTILVIVTALWCVQSAHAISASPVTIKPVDPYIYVDGGVHTPGRYVWFAGMTVADAIHAAGGFTDSATRRFTIYHHDGRAEFLDRHLLAVTTKPPLLKAGDMISVPKRIF